MTPGYGTKFKTSHHPSIFLSPCRRFSFLDERDNDFFVQSRSAGSVGYIISAAVFSTFRNDNKLTIVSTYVWNFSFISLSPRDRNNTQSCQLTLS
jgi:hypothetical protein